MRMRGVRFRCNPCRIHRWRLNASLRVVMVADQRRICKWQEASRHGRVGISHGISKPDGVQDVHALMTLEGLRAL